MGHSVGAYMALHVLEKRPQNVDNVFLLFPILSNIGQGSSFGRISRVLVSIPWAATMAAWLIFVLRLFFPIPLLALFVRLARPLPGTSLSTTLAKFLKPASVQSFCYLAKSEFSEIRDLDTDPLTKYAKRVTAYYAVKDRWVPNFAGEKIMQIINQNGGDALICDEGFPHAFSLGTGLCETLLIITVHGPPMAKKIGLWISTLFHPISKSQYIERWHDHWTEERDAPEFSGAVGRETEQEADPLVNLSPDIGQISGRKQSIGGGIIVREQLIRDLE